MTKLGDERVSIEILSVNRALEVIGIVCRLYKQNTCDPKTRLGSGKYAKETNT